MERETFNQDLSEFTKNKISKTDTGKSAEKVSVSIR